MVMFQFSFKSPVVKNKPKKYISQIQMVLIKVHIIQNRCTLGCQITSRGIKKEAERRMKQGGSGFVREKVKELQPDGIHEAFEHLLVGGLLGRLTDAVESARVATEDEGTPVLKIESGVEVSDTVPFLGAVNSAVILDGTESDTHAAAIGGVVGWRGMESSLKEHHSLASLKGHRNNLAALIHLLGNGEHVNRRVIGLGSKTSKLAVGVIHGGTDEDSGKESFVSARNEVHATIVNISIINSNPGGNLEELVDVLGAKDRLTERLREVSGGSVPSDRGSTRHLVEELRAPDKKIRAQELAKTFLYGFLVNEVPDFPAVKVTITAVNSHLKIGQRNEVGLLDGGAASANRVDLGLALIRKKNIFDILAHASHLFRSEKSNRANEAILEETLDVLFSESILGILHFNKGLEVRGLNQSAWLIKEHLVAKVSQANPHHLVIPSEQEKILNTLRKQEVDEPRLGQSHHDHQDGPSDEWMSSSKIHDSR